MGASPTSRSRLVLAIHRLLLSTSRTPLRRVWAAAYRLVARGVTAYVAWGEGSASSYVRGGLAAGDFLPGLSDVDTVVVFGEATRREGIAADRARQRSQRLFRALPVAELLVEGPMIHESGALRDLVGTSALTFGLDRPGDPRAGYFGRHATFDWLRTLERPGLYATAADWRLLAGPDRRPPEGTRDPASRPIAAWLELLYWWRWVAPACMNPSGPRTAALCVKMIAEPVRIWLWLAHGERYSRRVDQLRAGLRRLPEEEGALWRAIELDRSLPRFPEPPLAEALSALVRLSARIAEHLSVHAREAGATEVRLAGADAGELIVAEGGRRDSGGGPERQQPSLRPLADWRALACPMLADESFVPVPGDPADPAVVSAAALAWPTGPYPALRVGDLMILPAAQWWRSRLRAVQCPVTDPVSFALFGGHDVASFPNLRGWSARDTARRAVAEHRAWLRGEPGSWAGAGSEGRALALLFTAARAALFLDSVEAGYPELPLTVSETARRLAGQSSAAAVVADEALERYREFAVHRRRPPAPTLHAMLRLVQELPPYAQADGGSGSVPASSVLAVRPGAGR